MLKLKNNEIWRFDTDQKNLLFEEYQFLDPLDLVMKKKLQIVLTNYFNIKETFLIGNYIFKVFQNLFQNENKF